MEERDKCLEWLFRELWEVAELVCKFWDMIMSLRKVFDHGDSITPDRWVILLVSLLTYLDMRSEGDSEGTRISLGSFWGFLRPKRIIAKIIRPDTEKNMIYLSLEQWNMFRFRLFITYIDNKRKSSQRCHSWVLKLARVFWASERFTYISKRWENLQVF